MGEYQGRHAGPGGDVPDRSHRRVLREDVVERLLLRRIVGRRTEFRCGEVRADRFVDEDVRADGEFHQRIAGPGVATDDDGSPVEVEPVCVRRSHVAVLDESRRHPDVRVLQYRCGAGGRLIPAWNGNLPDSDEILEGRTARAENPVDRVCPESMHQSLDEGRSSGAYGAPGGDAGSSPRVCPGGQGQRSRPDQRNRFGRPSLFAAPVQETREVDDVVRVEVGDEQRSEIAEDRTAAAPQRIRDGELSGRPRPLIDDVWPS